MEDHRIFAESLGRLLDEEDDVHVVGLVHEADSAQSAVDELAPDVVLIDDHISGRDGVRLTADIKRHHPSTVVVMLTDSVDDRLLLSAIDAGCSGFLTKDRTVEEVTNAVRSAAAGEALIPPAQLARLLPRLSRSHRAVGADLTDRERELLHHLARGESNRAIAAELQLSLNTVRNYVQSILTKLGAHSKLEAVWIAVREGVIDYPSTG